MRWLSGAGEHLRMLLFRRRENAEMDEELLFHLDMETEQNIRLGMAPREARRRARVAFGGLEGHRESLRQGRRWPLLEDGWHDLRYGARSLRRTPGFAATIVLALALGIGTSVAVFSVVRQLVTHAVPFEDPEMLFSVEIAEAPGVGIGRNPTGEEFRAWRNGAANAADVAALRLQEAAIGDGTHTAWATAYRVSEGFLSILGVRPLLGRTFTADDHLPSSPPVVVLTEALWERHFGRDENIVGRRLHVDGQPHAVVGVVPRGLEFPSIAEFWVPLPETELFAADLSLGVIGRLRDGRTPTEARALLETLHRAMEADDPEPDRVARVGILPLPGRNAARSDIAVRLLQGAVLLVLLIGIANGAGLMLTRGMLRRREIAARTALGASRFRIVRQILAESALLAAAGGALGLAVGWGGIELLRSGLPPSMTRQMLGWAQMGLDARAALFSLMLAATGALACGLVPALNAVRGNPAAGLGSGSPDASGGGAGGRAGSRTARLLVTGEVALSLTLLLTAGLLARSLVELLRSETGYATEGVLTAQWVLPPGGYADDGIQRLQDQLLERARALPGVSSAAITAHLPTAPFGATRRYRTAGSDPDTEGTSAAWRPVTPDYLRTMGIELLRGRHFRDADDTASAGVVIVDASIADRLVAEGTGPEVVRPDPARMGGNAGAADALGTRIEVDGVSRTVVGVARTMLNPVYPGALRRTLYVPQAQAPTRSGYLVLRDAGGSAVPPPDLARAVHEALWSLDPDIAVGATATMADIASDLRGVQRVMAVAIAIFALISLVITIISLYALVAHAVATRQRELGIRMALGAGPRQLLRSAMMQGMTGVAIGAAFGLLLSAGIARLVAGLLYGVRPLDPVVFTLVLVGLLALALLATYLPARRAATTDAMISLRCE